MEEMANSIVVQVGAHILYMLNSYPYIEHWETNYISQQVHVLKSI